MRNEVIVVIFLTLWCGPILSSGMEAQQLPPELIVYPDLIVHNGKVLTADDRFTIVQAFAVRDGRFQALGTNERILAMAGPGTRKIDLGGKTVLPGLIDTHAHGWVGMRQGSATIRRLERGDDGILRASADRPATLFQTGFAGSDLEDGLVKVKAIVEKEPEGKFLYIATIRNSVSLQDMDRWQLDKVAPKNPVLIGISPSEFLVNTLAMEEIFRSGILSPDSMGIQKDPETGEPNGQMWGLASGEYFMAMLPWPEDWDTRLVELQKQQNHEDYVKQGLTTRIGRAQGLAVTVLNELYRKEGPRGLGMRVRPNLEFLRKNAKYLIDLRRLGNISGIGDDWLKIIGTGPQQVDGAHSLGTMRTKAPKIRLLPNDPFGPFGRNYWDDYPEGYVKETIVNAARYGWNITSLHSYGDGSVELIMDAFAAAAQARPFKRRWVIDHSWFHTPDTLEKAKELGVLFSVLPWWGMSGEETDGELEIQRAFGGVTRPALYMYGGDYWYNASPAKSLIQMGFKPMAEGSGLAELQAFITRKDESGRVWNPSERVSRQEALWMHSNWAAYYTMEEDRLGSIEVGKLADFVVLGRDYMTVPEDEISEIPVLMTVVGGISMFEEPGTF